MGAARRRCSALGAWYGHVLLDRRPLPRFDRRRLCRRATPRRSPRRCPATSPPSRPTTTPRSCRRRRRHASTTATIASPSMPRAPTSQRRRRRIERIGKQITAQQAAVAQAKAQVASAQGECHPRRSGTEAPAAACPAAVFEPAEAGAGAVRPRPGARRRARRRGGRRSRRHQRRRAQGAAAGGRAHAATS